MLFCFFFFKQKTAYEMRISDWSSDVCSSDLLILGPELGPGRVIIGGLDRAVEDAPAPAVDEQAEGQEGDLVHRLPQQQADILVGARHLRLVEQADVDQVLRGCRQRDAIAERKSTRLKYSH